MNGRVDIDRVRYEACVAAIDRDAKSRIRATVIATRTVGVRVSLERAVSDESSQPS